MKFIFAALLIVVFPVRTICWVPNGMTMPFDWLVVMWAALMPPYGDVIVRNPPETL